MKKDGVYRQERESAESCQDMYRTCSHTKRKYQPKSKYIKTSAKIKKKHWGYLDRIHRGLGENQLTQYRPALLSYIIAEKQEDGKKKPEDVQRTTSLQEEEEEEEEGQQQQNNIYPKIISPWLLLFTILTHLFSGFGGLVVSMLASGTRVRGFEPGRSRWIFLVSE